MDKRLERMNARFWGTGEEGAQGDHQAAYNMGKRGQKLTVDNLIGALARQAKRIDDNRTLIVADLRTGKLGIEQKARELAYEDGRLQVVPRSRNPREERAPRGRERERERATSFDDREEEGLWSRAKSAFNRLIGREEPEAYDAYGDTYDDGYEERDEGRYEQRRYQRQAQDLAYSYVPFQPEVDDRTWRLIVKHNIAHKEKFSKRAIFILATIIGALVFAGSMVVDFYIIKEFWTRALANEFLEVPPDLVTSVWSKSAQVVFSAFAIHFFLKAIGWGRHLYMICIFLLTLTMLAGFGFLNAQNSQGSVELSATEPANDAILDALGLGVGAGTGPVAGVDDSAAPVGTAAPGAVGILGLFPKDWQAPLSGIDGSTVYMVTLSVIFLIVTSVGAFCMQVSERNFANYVSALRYRRRQREFTAFEDSWAAWHMDAATLNRIDDPHQKQKLLIDYLMERVNAYYIGASDRKSGIRVPSLNGLRPGETVGAEDVDGDGVVDEYYEMCLDAYDKWAALSAVEVEDYPADYERGPEPGRTGGQGRPEGDEGSNVTPFPPPPEINPRDERST